MFGTTISAAKQGLGGGALGGHDADAQGGRFQHERIVGALADGDDGGGAEVLHIGTLLLPARSPGHETLWP